MKKSVKTTVLALAVTALAFQAGHRAKVFASSPDAAEKRVISYPEDYVTDESGASSYEGIGDHADSPYFRHPDFYNMENTDTLTILSHFKTYQQTTEFHCGPASALMVLQHYGKTDIDELSMGEIMQTHEDLNGSNEDEPGVADEQGEWGTSTDRMLQYFDHIGWKTSSSLTDGTLEGGATFDDPIEFRERVIENLSDNTPTMVEWLDWAGHWQVIIGYDTMGTEHFGDDVMIMADPYDTSDHCQDGYYIVNAERFFYMWLDAGILPENQSQQQWIIAKPE